MDQDTSDIGRAWEDALDKYCKDTGTNIKYLPQMKWNVSAIIGEQERQVETFNKYRHNKGMTDKFRSLISKNSVIIQSVANNIASSASSAFPPSAAILTAFTYVMKASKNVSDDYDQVAAFFEIMGSLMERLSLLETKLPSAKNYKTILMRVFTSLMGLCGTATKYVTEGRFKHWLKALYRGTDDEIKGEYNKLETNIQRLESATMFATLATVMETKSDVKDLTTISMQSLKVGTQTLAISNQTLSVAMETQTMVGGMSMKQDETLSAIKKFGRMLAKEESKKEEKESSKGKSKDSGAKKNAALNLVKTTFATSAEPAIQLKEIQTSFVQGTFGWVDQEESFKTFMDGDSPFLWISGPPGIGKSCMAYNIIGKLLESTGSDSRSSVAYYFFKEEHEELRSARNMLRAAVIQTAIGDGKYRDEVAAELKIKGTEMGEGVEGIWERFFKERYPKDGEQKLVIVLDGLDEAEKEDRDQILGLLEVIKKEDLGIQVVFTSRVVKEIEDVMGDLKPARVEITKEKISNRGGDLWKIIMRRCRTLSKLKRLQKPALRKIGMKLRLKADSVLYVEHMLRRLNVLGRESLIFKELDKLPEDLPKLYEMLLAECQKDRSKEQLSALKKLFAWLAYSKRPLTLGEATSLIKVVPGTKSFSLEEEIDGRSARILDLATDVAGADDGSSGEETDSELNEKQSDEESPNSLLDNSITSPLKFQERSMRQYFRAMEVDENGLRSSPSQGHFTIFEMAARIMNTSEDTDEKGDETSWQLRHYAVNFWLQHFLDIGLESTSDEGVQTVISSLYMIMNPGGQGLKNIEWYMFGDENHNFLGPAPYTLREQFFTRFDAWLARGVYVRRMTEIEFDDDVVRWMQTCTSEEETLVHLAKGHVMNWYKANRSHKARSSFKCARSTLRLTSMDHGLADDSGPDDHCDKDIMAVANAFPDLEKNGNAFLAIGMTFYSFQLYTELFKDPLDPFQKALDLASNDAERYFFLFWNGQYELELSGTFDEEEDKIGHVRKSYDFISASVNLYHEKEEVKKFVDTEDTKFIHQDNLTNRARCEIKLNEIDKALATMEEAYAVLGDEVDSSLDDEFVTAITASLEKEGDFEKLLGVVGQFKKWDLLFWIGFASSTGHDRFQHAAWECKKQDFMIKTYENMINEIDKFNSGAHIRSQLATVYQYVFPDYEAAKKLLYEVMDGKKGVPFGDADEEFIFETRLQLSDILMEQFRASADPDQKLSLLGEMKKVALQRNVGLFNEFNPFESQTVISLALLTGKMGPTTDFQTMMDRTFRGCIDALTDTHAWNDSQGFRLLAKVLAFVPEMKKDAQIAFSLQFSAVDDKLFNPPEEAEEVKAVATNGDVPEAEKAVAVEANEAPVQVDNIQTTKITEVPAETEEFSLVVQNETGQLNPNSEIYCNGCSNRFTDWTEGAVYGCLICTNCDLCESCWQKMDQHNKGEPWKEWKASCGKNHKYVKGPIAGWKGVLHGVLRIEDFVEAERQRTMLIGPEAEEYAREVTNGELKPPQVDEIKFDDWLDGVQERWAKAWEGFWKKEDLVVDIL